MSMKFLRDLYCPKIKADSVELVKAGAVEKIKASAVLEMTKRPSNCLARRQLRHAWSDGSLRQ
jgi:hypothetical protein